MVEVIKNKKYLNKEEAIKAIVGAIPESQLKKLEVHCPNGKIITFEEQLSITYIHKYCKYKTKEEIQSAVYLKSFYCDWDFLKISFDDIFQEENPEQIEFIKEKQWKKQQIHMWISSFGVLVSIIIPIILKYS